MSLYLELHVKNFADTEKFYNALGFEKVWQNEKHNGYMVMKGENAVLQFYAGDVEKHSFFKNFSQHSEHGLGVEVCIAVADVEQAYLQMQKFLSGNPQYGKVVSHITKKPWGLTDFRITDPTGYYLRITESYNPLTER